MGGGVRDNESRVYFGRYRGLQSVTLSNFATFVITCAMSLSLICGEGTVLWVIKVTDWHCKSDINTGIVFLPKKTVRLSRTRGGQINPPPSDFFWLKSLWLDRLSKDLVRLFFVC